MARFPSRNAIPWPVTILVVGALLYLWLQLFTVNVNFIEGGKLAQVNLNTVVSRNLVDLSGVVAAVVVVVGVAYRARKKSIPLLIQEVSDAIGKRDPIAGSAKSYSEVPSGGWGVIFSVIFKDVLLSGKLGECEDFQQWLSHFMAMWGFIGLAVTTTLDAVFNFAAMPLPITNPIRLLGNVTGIVFVAGVTLSLSRRLVHSDVRTASKAGDWWFLVALYGTALTGFMVESFADTSNVLGAWITYPLHLAFIALLLVTAPWTKFVHALWRPTWLVYTRLNGQRE